MNIQLVESLVNAIQSLSPEERELFNEKLTQSSDWQSLRLKILANAQGFAPNARQGLLTLAKIKHELETRIGRKVDITLKESIENSENWIRRNEILKTAQVIYEQR